MSGALPGIGNRARPIDRRWSGRVVALFDGAPTGADYQRRPAVAVLQLDDGTRATRLVDELIVVTQGAP